MGQAIETYAVADAIRATLEIFLGDHPEMEHADVDVAREAEPDGCFTVSVCGVVFDVSVQHPDEAA